ncbi:hypothetical protein HDU93_000037 [Gonapodya sp. JEL0774]|nr:hypothetical protein HDU93_000037 [Gonapodya sp. JEL0774]
MQNPPPTRQSRRTRAAPLLALAVSAFFFNLAPSHSYAAVPPTTQSPRELIPQPRLASAPVLDDHATALLSSNLTPLSRRDINALPSNESFVTSQYNHIRLYASLGVNGTGSPLSFLTRQLANVQHKFGRSWAGTEVEVMKNEANIEAFETLGGSTVGAARRRRRAEKRQSSLTLIDNQDATYYGAISMGTPGQSFQVVFAKSSTYSSTTVAVTSQGTTGGTSTVNTNQLTLAYGSGTVVATTGQDTLTVVGITVPSAGFGQVFKATSATSTATFQSVGFDGLFGLGYDSLAEGNVTSPFTLMMNQNLVPQPIFSFYLNTTVVDNVVEDFNYHGGILTFGGIYSPLVGTGGVVYNDVVRQGYWEIGIQKVAIANTTVYQTGSTTTAQTAVIDTGTSLIVVPTSSMKNIAAAVGATAATGSLAGSGIYTIDCNVANNMPDLKFTFQNVILTVQGIDLVIMDTTGGRSVCYLTIEDGGSSVKNLWIIGDVLLR